MLHLRHTTSCRNQAWKLLICLFLTVLLSSVTRVNAVRAETGSSYSPQQELVDKCVTTFKSLMADPNMTWLRTHIQSAKGIFICPQYMKGAFIFGADGGTGVLLGRNNRTGQWSYPAFYSMGSISFGLQAGAEVSEVVLLVMTDNGMDALMSTSFKLGADVSVAAGPVGAGAKAQTTDILAFAKSSGLFGGVSIEGAVITARDAWNRKYYGRDVRPVDIIIRRNVSNPGAEKLRRLIARTVSPERPAVARVRSVVTPPPVKEPMHNPVNKPATANVVPPSDRPTVNSATVVNTGTDNAGTVEEQPLLKNP